jgi:hypothetical protein
VAAFALAGGSGGGFNHLSETLIGYQSQDGQSVAWQLSYADLEGAVTQSHIHFAQRGVNGAIIVFLCSNLGNGPGGEIRAQLNETGNPHD